jgi:hypothetical protein
VSHRSCMPRACDSPRALHATRRRKSARSGHAAATHDRTPTSDVDARLESIDGFAATTHRHSVARPCDSSRHSTPPLPSRGSPRVCLRAIRVRPSVRRRSFGRRSRWRIQRIPIAHQQRTGPHCTPPHTTHVRRHECTRDTRASSGCAVDGRAAGIHDGLRTAVAATRSLQQRGEHTDRALRVLHAALNHPADRMLLILDPSTGVGCDPANSFLSVLLRPIEPRVRRMGPVVQQREDGQTEFLTTTHLQQMLRGVSADIRLNGYTVRHASDQDSATSYINAC